MTESPLFREELRSYLVKFVRVRDAFLFGEPKDTAIQHRAILEMNPDLSRDFDENLESEPDAFDGGFMFVMNRAVGDYPGVVSIIDQSGTLRLPRTDEARSRTLELVAQRTSYEVKEEY